MTYPFAPLPLRAYQTILADPPWLYRAGGDRNATSHYPCLDLEALCRLPVHALAHGDAVLFLWVTDPLLDQAFRLIKAWGFKYKTVAFTWAKLSPRGGAWHMGAGYYTRANPEMVLLATRGEPGLPLVRDTRQLVVSPVRQHSRKPDDVAQAIERMYPHHRRVELFARQTRPGWDAWGNELTKFDGAA